jgi:hypothetical protein
MTPTAEQLAERRQDGIDCAQLGYPITANPYQPWTGKDAWGRTTYHSPEHWTAFRAAWDAGWHTHKAAAPLLIMGVCA